MQNSSLYARSALVGLLGMAAAGCTVESGATQPAAGTPSPASQPAANTNLLADGTWVSANGAVLTVRNGQPVGYTFGNYRANALSLRDRVLYIDQARLAITDASADAFSGTFSLSGSTTAVSFQRQG